MTVHMSKQLLKRKYIAIYKKYKKTQENEIVFLKNNIKVYKMTYVIYTKPKCIYCDKIKELLQFVEPVPKWIDASKYLETPNSKQFFLDFIRDSGKLDRHYTTFPIVFYDGIFIGGYTETSTFHELDELGKKTFLLDKFRPSKP